MFTTTILLAMLVALPASYVAMVYARRYIATHRGQQPVSFKGNLTHGKSWAAVLFSAVTTGAVLYGALTNPVTEGYELPATVLLGAVSVILVASGLCLTVIDLRTMKLPTKIIYPTLLAVFALLTLVSLVEGDYNSIVTTLVGSIGLWLVMFLLWFFVPGGVGFGDVRLVLLTGGLLGWFSLPHVFIGFTLAFVTMSLVYLPLMITKAVGRKTKAPLGPWLIVGALLAVIFGDILSGILITGGL